MDTLVVAAATDSKPKKKLLDQVRDVMRLKHYSLRTEQAYTDWSGLVRSGRKETELGVLTNAITRIWRRSVGCRDWLGKL